MAARHSELLAACVALISARGGMATRLQAGRVQVKGQWMHLGKTGWPDIVGCLPSGRFIGVEVKVAQDKTSHVQKHVHANLARRNALVVVVRKIADLEAALT